MLREVHTENQNQLKVNKVVNGFNQNHNAQLVFGNRPQTTAGGANGGVRTSNFIQTLFYFRPIKLSIGWNYQKWTTTRSQLKQSINLSGGQWC
jgi:hypothetical protein